MAELHSVLIEEVITAGMDDYVTEPIRVDALVAALLATVPQSRR